MELNTVLLIFTALSSFSAICRIMARRSWAYTKGWLVVNLLVLAVAGFTYVSLPDSVGSITFTVWVLLILFPYLLSIIIQRMLYKHNHKGAYYLSLICRLLHPADGWLEQPLYYKLGGIAQNRDKAQLSQILEKLEKGRANERLIAFAKASLYRLNYQWVELAKYLETEFEKYQRLRLEPTLLGLYLRALGETKQLNRMVEVLQSQPNASNFLLVFAFTGKEQEVENLLTGSLNRYSFTNKNFWRLTAKQAAIARQHDELIEYKREKLFQVMQEADTLELEENGRNSLKWRWENSEFLLNNETELTAKNEAILRNLFQQLLQAENYKNGLSLSKHRPFVTFGLIILNVLYFIIEEASGGSQNTDVLYNLGALVTPYVTQSAEWWRILVTQFLHYGPEHLILNMLALLVIGPYVEYSLGKWRFLAIYFGSSIVALTLIVLMSVWEMLPAEELVGASGGIMGLVGASGYLYWYDWQKQGVKIARNRFLNILFIVGTQAFLDLVVLPQDSFMAHLSGAILGFAFTGLFINFRNRPTQIYQNETKDVTSEQQEILTATIKK